MRFALARARLRRNSVVMGARRDLVAELTAALRERGLKAGIFLELAEAANPLCPASGMETGSIRWNVPPGSCKAAYSSYLQTQLREAIERFEPDLVYLDVRPPARRVPRPALAFWQLLPPLGRLPARALRSGATHSSSSARPARLSATSRAAFGAPSAGSAARYACGGRDLLRFA